MSQSTDWKGNFYFSENEPRLTTTWINQKHNVNGAKTKLLQLVCYHFLKTVSTYMVNHTTLLLQDKGKINTSS